MYLLPERVSRCPHVGTKVAGDEYLDFCDLTDGVCLLESAGGNCVVYEDHLEEGKMDKRGILEIVDEIDTLLNELIDSLDDSNAEAYAEGHRDGFEEGQEKAFWEEELVVGKEDAR